MGYITTKEGGGRQLGYHELRVFPFWKIKVIDDIGARMVQSLMHDLIGEAAFTTAHPRGTGKEPIGAHR